MEEGQERVWSEQNQDAWCIVLNFSKKILVNEKLCFQSHCTQDLRQRVMRTRAYTVFMKKLQQKEYISRF